jgi:D-aminopeptidase
MDETFVYGRLKPGPLNAITDVPGVRVAHVTHRRAPPDAVHTGLTVIAPLEVDYTEQSVFAGFHRLNGFGEVAGAHWIQETGILTTPIFLTSTYSLGTVRDALMLEPVRRGVLQRFHHPFIGETNDGFLNGYRGGLITPEDVELALQGLKSGPVEQGCVGGGTGMIAYGFKAGIGTASRLVETPFGPVTVGVLVQANHGRRADLRIDGRPLADYSKGSLTPEPRRTEDGSIIIVVATDAPLMPPQCTRLAQRAVLGLGRVGGLGHNSSGDFAVAFSTTNRLPALGGVIAEGLRMFPNDKMTPLFEATIEASEAAIINSLLAAETSAGVGGTKVWSLSREAMDRSITTYQAM